MDDKKGSKCYFADDIVETEDKTVYGIEIDSKTGEERLFECKINWNNMPLSVLQHECIFPLTTVFYLSKLCRKVTVVFDE